MFSDIGLGPGIIQDRRGTDLVFLRTAWTLQVVRGLFIWLACFPLAFAVYWSNHEPLFFWLVPIAGLTCVMSGFNSVSLITCRRRLSFGRFTLLNLSANAAGTTVMICCAWVYPSVWALLANAFVSAGIVLAGSFLFLPEVSMRWQWDPESVRGLFRFGRWIFVGTALTFLVSRLDIFILGSAAGMAVLGVYATAKNFAFAALDALGMLASTVLMPVYSRLAERGDAAMRRQTLKMRALLLAIFLPPFWVLAIGGPYLIRILYDNRYQDAGWMIQILAAGAVGTAISATTDQVLLARGDSFRYMLQLGSKLVIQLAGMSIGWHFAGLRGFMIGLAIADVLNYPVLMGLVRKYGVWLPGLDAVAYGLSAAVIITGWLLV
jgi:O-antigen/teichoic acid export membrane protein